MCWVGTGWRSTCRTNVMVFTNLNPCTHLRAIVPGHHQLFTHPLILRRTLKRHTIFTMPEQPKHSMLQSLRNWGGTSILSLPDSPRRTCLTWSCITIEARSLSQSFLYREFRTANTPRHPNHSPTCSSIPVLPYDVYTRLALLLLPELEQLQDRCCWHHSCMEWTVCITCYAEKSGMYQPFLQFDGNFVGLDGKWQNLTKHRASRISSAPAAS